MPEKNNEIEEQTIDIIIATAENIKDRNKFYNDITSQIVPVRIKWIENAGVAILVIGSKNITEVFAGIGEQKLVLFTGIIIHIPVIISGAVNMYRYPANGNTGKDFKKKQAHQNPAADTGIFNKRHTQQQPA